MLFAIVEYPNFYSYHRYFQTQVSQVQKNIQKRSSLPSLFSNTGISGSEKHPEKIFFISQKSSKKGIMRYKSKSNK